jgi:sulfur-oxidizing protein SoxY
MNVSRRSFLKNAGNAGALAAALAAGLVKPSQVLAAEWNKAAFTATKLDEGLRAMGLTGAVESKDIVFKNLPDIAENGAVVPVEVESRIPGTQSITLVIDTNLNPVCSTYEFSNGALGYIHTRVKMAKTSRVRAMVKAGGKVYQASKEVKVTLGGCGG